MKKSPSWLTPIAFLVITVGVLGGGYALLTQTAGDTTKTEQREIEPDQWAQEGEYYTTTWEYPISEGRTGTVGFKVSLDEDTITAADIEILTTNEESMSYQNNFKAAMQQEIVGKKISELSSIDRVGGASSTTEHFKEAVSALEMQLKS